MFQGKVSDCAEIIHGNSGYVVSFAQVKLVGEGADDAGGVFDETVTEMCDELICGTVPLLIPTPNAASETGYNRDKFLLNPSLTQPQHLMWFKFLGE